MFCVISAVCRNCDEILRNRLTKNPNKNSIYPIDPDQGGKLEIFGAVCDFLPDIDIGVTYVGISFTSREHIPHLNFTSLLRSISSKNY